MMKFNNVLKVKTILLAISMLSLSYNMVYSSCLRAPLRIDNHREEDLLKALKRNETELGPVKILLVNIVDKEKVAPNYPIGLYTLKSFIEKNSPVPCRVVIKDVFFETLEDIVAFAEKYQPDILGSSVKTENTSVFNNFMELLGSSGMPDPKVHVIGRQVATFGYGKVLEKYPGVVCARGEGELALLGLVDYVRGKKDLRDVNNIAYSDETTGRIIETERTLLPSFEPIGLIDHSDMLRYLEIGANPWIEASRGCPWGGCRFCSITEFWGETRRRREKPVDTIIAELRQLTSMGVERFTFSDEEFIGFGIEGLKRARRIAQAIVKSGIKISFHLDSRSASIWNRKDTPEERELRIDTLRLLKQAGLKTIFIGMETGSPAQLKRYNKGSDVATAEEAIKACREVGINIAIGFIMIDPLVSKDEILESIAFIRRNRILPNLSIPLNRLRIYTGSPYIKWVRKEEQHLKRRLMSDRFNPETLIFEIKDYKYPAVKVIVDLVERYAETEYDFYNALRWFERFDPSIFGIHEMDEYAYIKEAAETAKECQIEFLYQLASLTDEELLQTQKPGQILREAIAKRDEFIMGLKKAILRKGHAKECNAILLQIDKYFATILPIRQIITNQTISNPVSESL